MFEVFKDDGVMNKPMVLAYHGWTGCKEEKLMMANELAKNGFYVVAADANMHGERKSQKDALHLGLFFEVIENTTNEINKIIDFYSNCGMIDSAKIGLTGTSMGGCVVFNYLTRTDKKIVTAVTVVSSPDWLSIINSLESISQRFNKRFSGPSFDGYFEELKKIASEIQPVNEDLEVFDIPLLMLNGELDEVIQFDKVKSFCSKFDIYDDKDKKIELIAYPTIDHRETTDMIKETVDWFKKYL